MAVHSRDAQGPWGNSEIRGRESRIVVVLPALNEAGSVGAQIRALRVHAALRALPITRVLVVDNGSTDDTAAVARLAGAEVISEPRRGYGWACRAGLVAATDADIILLMDADGSDDLTGAARAASLVLDGAADLAVGSRTRGACDPGALTLQQRVGNAVGALVLRLVYGLRVSDLGPTRAIRRDALLRLDMCEMGFGWSTEMLAKAARAGLRVREVPVDYHRRSAGTSKVAGTLRGALRASLHILRTLARYTRWRPAVPDSAPLPRQALFIVARLPLAGATKTRLGQVLGHEGATRLYAAFLRDLGARFSRAAHADGYDLYWYAAMPEGYQLRDFLDCVPPGGRTLLQEGSDFAARLWRGFVELASRGYERIVVLGSDSPHVPAARVAAAFAHLERHDVVLGPARDGGYYLLGQRGTPRDLFRGITMSTPTVCDETLARARELALRVALIPETFDVDEAGDLATLRAALAGAPSAEADACPATEAELRALAHDQPNGGFGDRFVVGATALEGASHVAE